MCACLDVCARVMVGDADHRRFAAARVRPDSENEPRQINSGGDSARWSPHEANGKTPRVLGFERRFDREARVVDRTAKIRLIAFTDETPRRNTRNRLERAIGSRF